MKLDENGEPIVLWPGQKIGTHDHKPYDNCPRDCPAHPEYPNYVIEFKEKNSIFYARYRTQRITR